ncbi:hypothetical protein VP01_9660g1 [Puccinia sorghi]|uniref:Uncharacterized protein n=1 Tax=Puccinia sorghi TaxID=27349 RepID=A0A0L6U869_9BASI|nr:hypothetical protein VP01_9660g1 [Puccinia sorghi]
MASAADIQAIISAAMDAQAQHLQQQLNSRDEIISKLMSKDTSMIQGVAWREIFSNKERQGINCALPWSININTYPTQRPISLQARFWPTNTKKYTAKDPSLPEESVDQDSQDNLSCGQSATDDDSKNAHDALYVHIKIIRNFLKQKSIPGLPHPNTLTEFNSRFSDAAKIAQIVDNVHGAPLVPIKEIVSLKRSKEDRPRYRQLGQLFC